RFQAGERASRGMTSPADPNGKRPAARPPTDTTTPSSSTRMLRSSRRNSSRGALVNARSCEAPLELLEVELREQHVARDLVEAEAPEHRRGHVLRGAPRQVVDPDEVDAEEDRDHARHDRHDAVACLEVAVDARDRGPGAGLALARRVQRDRIGELEVDM